MEHIVGFEREGKVTDSLSEVIVTAAVLGVPYQEIDGIVYDILNAQETKIVGACGFYVKVYVDARR